MDESLLHRFVLQVNSGCASDSVDGIHLGVIALFGFTQEQVDKGSFARLRLESSLDEFFDFVIWHFNVDHLLGPGGSLKPENVFTAESNVVGVDAVADKLEPAWSNLLASAFSLKVSTGTWWLVIG